MPEGPSGAAPLTHRQILTVLGALVAGMILAALDQTIVSSALTSIVDDLGDASRLSWIVTGYLLAMAVSTMIQGKLGDLYGRRTMFRIAIVVFMVASLASGLATSVEVLVASRALQGVGAGGLIVLGNGIIGDVVSPRSRGRYEALLSTCFGTAAAAGPLLGGFLSDHLSWRWIFHLNVPVALAALVVASRVLPPSPRRRGTLDGPGMALTGAILATLVLAATWADDALWPTLPILAVVVTVLSAALVRVERRAVEPVLPPTLLRLRTFQLSMGLAAITGMAMFATITYLPLYLQAAARMSATTAGLTVASLMVGITAGNTVLGRRLSRTGRYRSLPIAGTSLLVVSFVLLALLGTGTSLWHPLVAMGLVGIGQGLTVPVLMIASQNAAEPGDLGVTTAAIVLGRSVGGALGVAVFAALVDRRQDSLLAGGASMLEAFAGAVSGTFWYVVPLLVAGVALAWSLPSRPLRSDVHPVLADLAERT